MKNSGIHRDPYVMVYEIRWINPTKKYLTQPTVLFSIAHLDFLDDNYFITQIGHKSNQFNKTNGSGQANYMYSTWIVLD